METIDQHRAQADERSTHHERAEDAPEQDTMLVFWIYTEVAEDHHHHEDVVDAEGLLDQVTGQIGEGGLGTGQEIDAEIKKQRE